jgi:hypothetical protein
MDTQALVAGLVGVALGASVCYRLVRRQWWAASSGLAICAEVLLQTVTEGNRSHLEHTVVWAVSMSLLLWFVIAIAAHQRLVRQRPVSQD